MAFQIIRETKKLLYGTIPYYFHYFFNSESEKIAYLKYIKDNGYTHYPYSFAEKYIDQLIDLKYDQEKDLKYIIHKGHKKLYFPNHLTNQKITALYKSLLIEQDVDSAHCYVDSIEEFRGRTILDIGAAEGITSLDAIEVAEHVYLFECQKEWIEALQATFEPWKEKVSIVEKYISNKNDHFSETLDHFLADKPKDHLFLKMDIEGMECFALEGARQLMSSAKDLQFAICTYHRKDDKKRIASYLNKNNCTFFARKGLFYVKHKLRTGLFRGYSN